MSGPGNGGLEADRHEIEKFYNLLFRYADDDTFLSLRIFDQFDRTKPALHIEGIKLSGNADTIIAAACRVATRAATATEPSVFAPPLATFATIARARGRDVSNGLTLSVELDQGDIAEARRRLEGLAPTNWHHTGHPARQCGTGLRRPAMRTTRGRTSRNGRGDAAISRPAFRRSSSRTTATTASITRRGW